jgi:hypothetical protein
LSLRGGVAVTVPRSLSENRATGGVRESCERLFINY